MALQGALVVIKDSTGYIYIIYMTNISVIIDGQSRKTFN